MSTSSNVSDKQPPPAEFGSEIELPVAGDDAGRKVDAHKEALKGLSHFVKHFVQLEKSETQAGWDRIVESLRRIEAKLQPQPVPPEAAAAVQEAADPDSVPQANAIQTLLARIDALPAGLTDQQLEERLQPLGVLLERLRQRLETIDQDLGTHQRKTAETLAGYDGQQEQRLQALLESTAARMQDRQQQILAALESQRSELEELLDARNRWLLAELQPDGSDPSAALADLKTALLGPQLGTDETFGAEQAGLVNGFLHGDPRCREVAGWLLVLQTAPRKEKSRILRPLGEAFYRWLPDSQNREAFEAAVVQWINKCCREADLPTSVSTVTPDSRFDSERHVTDGPLGRQVTEVQGWLVRTGDKVFEKARVAAR